MQTQRQRFREFLLRLSANELRDSDWSEFASQRSADEEEVEVARARLVKASSAFPDWTVGWVPRPLQHIAAGLASELEDQGVFYHANQHVIEDDGTIRIRTSWYSADSCTIGECIISQGDSDYQFWRWLVTRGGEGAKVKSASEIEILKRAFARETTCASDDARK